MNLPNTCYREYDGNRTRVNKSHNLVGQPTAHKLHIKVLDTPQSRNLTFCYPMRGIRYITYGELHQNFCPFQFPVKGLCPEFYDEVAFANRGMIFPDNSQGL